MDKAASVALSAANETATQGTTASTWGSVRATTGFSTATSSAKVIFNCTLVSIDTSHGWICGMGDSVMTITNYPGATGNSFGYQGGNGSTYAHTITFNADCYDNNVGMVPGDILWIAVDLGNRSAWCSKSCATWGTAASANGDPDTNTAPNITLSASTMYFPTWGGYDAGSADAVTLGTNPSLGACGDVTTFITWDAAIALAGGSSGLMLRGAP